MKNLKKLSRNDLRCIDGGKKLLEPGNCGDACSPGDGRCEQYGLSCDYYGINNGGTVTSHCWKCM